MFIFPVIAGIGHRTIRKKNFTSVGTRSHDHTHAWSTKSLPTELQRLPKYRGVVIALSPISFSIYTHLSKPMTTMNAPSRAHTILAPLVPAGPFPCLSAVDPFLGLNTLNAPSLLTVAKYLPQGDHAIHRICNDIRVSQPVSAVQMVFRLWLSSEVRT